MTANIKNKPKVSIIIPCYNHELFIEATLESVFKQTYSNYECIIINDGSTDDCEDKILKKIRGQKKIKYYKINNQGLSKSRNLAIEIAQGEFILPLDSDDKISENYIELCIQKFKQKPNCVVAYGRTKLFGNTNIFLKQKPYVFNDLLFKNMIHCCGLFKKSDWQRVGGYDEKLINGFEDWEFWINMLKNGGEAICVDKAVFFYRKSGVSMISKIVRKDYGYQERLYIFRKYENLYLPNGAYDLYFQNYKNTEALMNLEHHLTLFQALTVVCKIVFVKCKMEYQRIIKKIKYTNMR